MTAKIKRGTYTRTCKCGWSGTYDTPGRAKYAKRRHSCEKWEEKLDRRSRHVARMNAVDKSPKPCLHKEAEHQHGTYACYVLDLCRCPPCAKAHKVYETNRIRQHAYGRWDNYVDATPGREHIRSLMDQGMGLKRIVAVSDISQGLLWKLVYGKKKPDGTRTPSKRVRKDTLERILAIRLDLADGAIVDNTGTTRRLQALVALGWSQSKLGKRLGIMPANMTPLMQGRRSVTVETANAVRALYEELSMTFPPEKDHRDKIAASRARKHAKTNGWLPPLAWDDGDLDDPAVRPVVAVDVARVRNADLDEVAIYRRMHGDRTVRLSRDESAELVRRWRASGRSLADCERLTGIATNRYREGAA